MSKVQNKKIIYHILKDYDMNITELATDMAASRSQIYAFMKGSMSKKSEQDFKERLFFTYSEAFPIPGVDMVEEEKEPTVSEVEEENEEDYEEVYEEDECEDERAEEKSKIDQEQKELFTGENQDIIPKNATEVKKGNKYFTPSRFLKLKNLRCKNDCFFMKASIRDMERIRPNCPDCGEMMLTKEERKKMGLEF